MQADLTPAFTLSACVLKLCPLPTWFVSPCLLQVILKDEDLDPAFDFREAAELSDGYSGKGWVECCWHTAPPFLLQGTVGALALLCRPRVMLPLPCLHRTATAAPSLTPPLAGSDLKNLCIAAAYCPIREHLEAERAATAAAKAAAAGAAGGPAASGSAGESAAATAAAAAAAAASSATPAALAAVAAHVVPQAVRLRSISMSDFKAALKQVGVQ